MKRCECRLISCRYCRERLQAAGEIGHLKPGPVPGCSCGACKTCRNRKARHQFYQRNRDAVIAHNAEAQRKRRQQAASAPPRPRRELTDAELDEMARRSLEASS